MDGRIEIEGNEMVKDSFTKTNDIERINLSAAEDSELFILQSPAIINYKKITDR